MQARFALLVMLGLAVAPATALAEKVTTNQATKLYARPGEAAKVLIEVKSGKGMTVLAKQGRWLKVRVSGRTGYVPRSKVDGADDMPRNTRRRAFVDGRGTRRGPGGEDAPDDRVGGDAIGEGDDEGGDDEGGDDEGGDDEGGDDEGGDDVEVEEMSGGREDDGDDRKVARVNGKVKVYSEADDDSDVVFVAREDEMLFPSEREGKFTFVENDEGDAGYVMTSKLDIEESDEGEEEESGPRDRQIDLRARLGVSILKQGIRAPGLGAGFPNNYNISTAAARIALGGAVMYPKGPKYVYGAELAYDLGRSTPGVKYMNTTTALTLHNLNLRGLVGYDLKKKSGAMIFGRLGLNYQSMQVANVADLTKNAAKIPSEVAYGPTIGAMFAMPAFSPTIGLRFSLDGMLFGSSVKQTRRLEDGANPSVKMAVLGAGLTYRYKPELTLQFTYDLNYASYSFGAQVADSNRIHGTAMATSRTDVMHTVSVGLAKAF
jgi:hypothetical protein